MCAGGLIPARAGKTVRGVCGRPGRGAHPRACGENRYNRTLAASLAGSSPRVRGKRGRRFRTRSVVRLIPARAGKTSCTPGRTPPPAAHPRACGENNQESARMRVERGSSPRVRGKHSPVDLREPARGLIPARAGKTRPFMNSDFAVPAHPRACGENKTLRCRGGGPRAHPRACGENRTRGVWESGFTGSSPRVRGKQDAEVPGWGAPGLIPARAGKTPWSSTPRTPPPAHPRACGENWSWKHAGKTLPGSSPRVRGKRDLNEPLRENLGLIPARAGKTAGFASGSG